MMKVVVLTGLSYVCLFLVLIPTVEVLSSGSSGDDPLVTLEQGKLKGGLGTARNGRQFYEFLGIPYGKVPQRFGVSKLADGWKDVRDATKPGPICLQYNNILSTVTGVEDCLVLNVYTPKLPNMADSILGHQLPVLVYIHGGGFFQGFGTEFGGKYLMSHDVVYVSINYRLGPLGFLNAENDEASGNQGLKDQVLALKWVKENIAKFGGDPNKVTIFGESAGAGSVSLLTLSPMAKGLFQSAISQSGTAICRFVDRQEDPLEEAKKLAAVLDCPTSDPSFMVKCLRRINAEDVVGASIPKHRSHNYFDVEGIPQFGPSVEKFHQKDLSEVFMPKSPLSLLQEGNFNRVPWIVGVNENEGIVVSAATVLGNATLLELINKEWGRIAPSTFLYKSIARDPCKVSSAVKKFYFGDEEIPISQDNRQALVNLYGDRFFVECTREAAKLYAKHAPVFLYNFTHKAEDTIGALFGWKYDEKLKTPSHADDTAYFFDFPVVPYTPGIPKGHKEETFSDNMIKLWISFARIGRPTDWGTGTVNWFPLNAAEMPLKWMNIGQTDLQLQPEDPEISKRLDFWTKINSEIRADPYKP